MRSYVAAVGRCRYKSSTSYHEYGGSGIKMLLTISEIKALWFRDCAMEMVKPTIDRINPDGNYTASNCRFLEMTENSSQRRNPYSVRRKPK